MLSGQSCTIGINPLIQPPAGLSIPTAKQCSAAQVFTIKHCDQATGIDPLFTATGMQTNRELAKIDSQCWIVR